MPASMHSRTRWSSTNDSRRMSAIAVPKMTMVPATFPRIISFFRHAATAGRGATIAGPTAISAIHDQLRRSSIDESLRDLSQVAAIADGVVRCDLHVERQRLVAHRLHLDVMRAGLEVQLLEKTVEVVHDSREV